MTELQQLEQTLAAHGGGDSSDALPPDFREKLTGLRAAGTGSSAVQAERQSHLAIAEQLLGQLDSADNLVVKSQKCRVIRAELNAVRLLDGI